MLKLRKRIIWSAAALCLIPITWLFAQDEPKAPAKKPQTVDVQIEVTDGKDGSPLDNVQILVKWGEEQSDSEKAVTNKAGVAKVKDVPRGTVTIRLIANGYKPVAPSVDLKTEKQPIKITLEKVTPHNESP